MDVIVFGPNLPGNGGEPAFHIHAVGCADTKRGIYRHIRPGGDQGGWIVKQADSVKTVVENVYGDFIFANDEDPWEDFVGDLKFFPCTDALPYESVT